MPEENFLDFFRPIFVLFSCLHFNFPFMEKKMYLNSTGLSISLGNRRLSKFWRFYLKKQTKQLVFELELKKNRL